MSLATGGLGGAGAGMSMGMAAHGGPTGVQIHQATSQPNSAGPPPGTTSAPISNAALGADLIDKNQLSKTDWNNAKTRPIVAVDLYGDACEVAFYPPSVSREGAEVDYVDEKGVKVQSLGKVWETMGGKKETASNGNLDFAQENEAIYKSVRKVLKKQRGYSALLDQMQTNATSSESAQVTAPQLLLGARQADTLPKSHLALYQTAPSSEHAIDTEPESSHPVTLVNSTLDGTSSPQNDDFDRVVINMKLHSQKKQLTMLPEEATALLLARAKRLAADTMTLLETKEGITIADGEENDGEGELYLEYPPALAIPAWQCKDVVVDALSDACHGTNPVLYQRSVAACAGALLPKFATDSNGKSGMAISKLHSVLNTRQQAHVAEVQKKAAKQKVDPETLMNDGYAPTVVLAGMTSHGLELAAVRIDSSNPSFGQSQLELPYGSIRVVSSVSYPTTEPLKIASKAFVELAEIVDECVPELEEEGGIAAVLTYGSISSQLALTEQIKKTLKGIQDDPIWNIDSVECMSTKPEIVAIGLATLGAVSHGRILPVNEGKKNRPACVVSNVSPTAIAVQYQFGKGRDWTEPKVIFDYDRRVPAGPYKLDLKASECLAVRKSPKGEDLYMDSDSEALVKEADNYSKGRYNADREEAALEVRVKILQRMERNGRWRQVGEILEPLANDSGGEREGKVAVESATLELSLDSIGYISVSTISDG
jgi:hypothetical protein